MIHAISEINVIRKFVNISQILFQMVSYQFSQIFQKFPDGKIKKK